MPQIVSCSALVSHFSYQDVTTSYSTSVRICANLSKIDASARLGVSHDSALRDSSFKRGLQLLCITKQTQALVTSLQTSEAKLSRQGITHFERAHRGAINMCRQNTLSRFHGSCVCGIDRAAHTKLARFAQPVFCDVARVIVTCRAQRKTISASAAVTWLHVLRPILTSRGRGVLHLSAQSLQHYLAGIRRAFVEKCWDDKTCDTG